MSTENQNDFERMERYIREEMSAEEVLKFEAELAKDEALRKELAVQQDLIRAIEIGGLEATLDEIHESLPRTKSKNKTRWMAIAASVAVVLTLSIWSVFEPETHEKLFAEYVTVEPGMPVPMSATDMYTFYDAMVDYKAENYEKAIVKWNPLLETDTKNDTLNYFVGSAYFNMDQFDKALPYFALAKSETNGSFYPKAQWYWILSQLKLKNTEAILEVVPSPNSPYIEQIEAIQKAL